MDIYIFFLYTTNHQHTEWITKMIQKEIFKHMQLAIKLMFNENKIIILYVKPNIIAILELIFLIYI